MADGNPRVSLPSTMHSVFYAHQISINGKAIGSFEKISVKAARQGVERIREILYSRGAEVKDIVWGGTDISIDLSRVEIYNESFMDAFGFSLMTLEQINQPVDIMEVQYSYASSAANNFGQPTANLGTPSIKRTTTYNNCVATNWSKDIDTGTTRIVESMTFECRTISITGA